MAAIIDFSNFTFTAEQIRSINELLFDAVLEAPEYTLLCTVYPGIVYDKQIGFIGDGGLIGKKRQNCDPVYQSWNVNTRALTWTPKAWEIPIVQCFADLEQTMGVYDLKKGSDIPFLEDTEYGAMIVSLILRGVKKFIMRLLWFNDTAADIVDEGGVITDGTDLSAFNILDGFFKQFLTLIAANPKQRVAITENAGATYAAQALNPNNMPGYLQRLKFNAPMVLRGQQASSFIVCTQSFYDAWDMYLQGKDLESTYTNLINGQSTLTYNGIPLIPMPVWDENIAQYENTGTKLNNPHRAILTVKENLAVGVDGEDSFERMGIWTDQKDRKTYISLMGKADAKVLNPAMFQMAI
jgi:hypothetical protein